jgi:colanic acid/amylovoran biosynthesis glycosyltransferase
LQPESLPYKRSILIEIANPQKPRRGPVHPGASLAYIAQSFPDFTQTFVYREVMALESLGMPVATFAIWKKPRDRVSEEARHYVEKTYYALPVSWPGFLFSHIFFLSVHPARYWKTALFVLSRRGEPFQNRARTFHHFCEAVYLAKEMRKRGIKHIHAHFSINAATVALVAARLLKITFSFTAHNILFRDRLILREKIREAKFIAAISEYTRQFLVHTISDDRFKDKIHLIHCGLEPDKFRPPETKPANRIPIILSIAQLTEKKGIAVLLEACKILAEEGHPFHCLIVGDGPQRAQLERLIDEWNLAGSLRLEGRVFQEQLKGYLEKADIFVLPCIVAPDGDRDGIPVSLMEAMAMEVPCVSTFVSGIPELIENGESGILVEEKNPAALADALKRLLADEELRKKLGERGRARVLQEFDVQKNACKLKRLFEHQIHNDD